MCVELHNANEASAQSRARRVVFWTRGAGDWNKLRCSAAGVGSVTFGKGLLVVRCIHVVSFLPVPTHGVVNLGRRGVRGEDG